MLTLKFLKGEPAFLEELCSLIVTKTREDIEKHEKWFQEYTKLNEQKKNAIKQWRENKKVSSLKKGEFLKSNV